jgi:rSAM/selenodomain-associated transferase 1
MRRGAVISVIIPALNEEAAIGKVLDAIPPWVDETIVADNGSTDRTAAIAREHGARVVHESERGYGAACLRAIAALDHPDVVVFLDGDHSDHPEQMDLLVDPIVDGAADLVIGSRALGTCEPGALTVTQRFGNRLTCLLVRLFWRKPYTDLGPFRAIRADSLAALRMRDRNYGWTVEMQVKAARDRLRTHEVPVAYRPRIGVSKISGTLRGVVGAGAKILYTVFAAALADRDRRRPSGGRKCLCVFTRCPEPGRVKTRLIPALGEAGAAALHADMVHHTLTWARELARTDAVMIEMRYHGGSADRMRAGFGPGLNCVPQGPGDLGARMSRAADAVFGRNVGRFVIVGTDCPGISADLVRRAFSILADNDLVLGPAEDGGYYLVGLGARVPGIFQGIGWGGSGVLEQTRRRATELGLEAVLLETLPDVDRPEDLPVWHNATGSSKGSR